MLPAAEIAAVAGQARLFEEFLARERKAGRLDLPLRALPEREAWLHGHCHQKAFGLVSDVATTLALVPNLTVRTIESGCCGMAGAFGYAAEHYEVSLRMAELDLLPALRRAPEGALVVADGTSCRQQIADGVGRAALHVARVLERALAG
jgi:Fe-S oxidoreductase